MLRVGILLDSYDSEAWIAKIIEDIQSSDCARIELVVLNTPLDRKKPRLIARLRNHWNRTLFRLYQEWDYKRNRSLEDAFAPVDLSELLADIPLVQVHPIRQRVTDRISEEELGQIKAFDLDVIFRFGFRIIRAGILDSARYGVWSFHHDDNQDYRGGPPLFWEIYERNPVSGTILQILTESLDGGHVIYKGHSSTQQTSLYLNRNANYWKTANFAIRRLNDLHRRGFEFIRSLETYDNSGTYSRRIYKPPNTPQMFNFLTRQLSIRLMNRMRGISSGNNKQWFLAFRSRTPYLKFDDPSEYRAIMPPNDRFYADPFIFERDEKAFLFFEDYRYAEKKAVLSCAELGPDGMRGDPVEVLRRPYHLSYPFLIEAGGEIFMIPETRENRTVELYRATKFPYEWKIESVLLKEIIAVDSTIHEYDGKLWMFAGISDGRFSDCDELGIFSSQSLTGPWLPHPSNPVISDVRRARPAGALFCEEGRLIRPSQDCARAYGHSILFSEVVSLNETEYRERPTSRMDPDWLPGNLGTHTYSRSAKFEVIDGNRSAKITTQSA